MVGPATDKHQAPTHPRGQTFPAMPEISVTKEGVFKLLLKLKNSEYDQEIPQSQTADNPMAPRGRAVQPSRDTRKTN